MKKTRKNTTIGKSRKAPETRTFPKYREGMTTRAYIQAYHEANATVNLTSVEYACK